MSVLALKVAHLEKGTSELVKAMGDSGSCPSITAATKVVIQLYTLARHHYYETTMKLLVFFLLFIVNRLRR